ncbi:hypothetical protein BCV70DRAFT_202362 [Testicularia cyperi]|uniref:FHA domain-containing protein n=1 Tax=Testicularia cyperi TaxID=1882483 RepID=A0A317XIF9_9BASI|nr:hypothetical protein BCV70DRAFT_202362 [Testicularia cyperi]
MFETLRRSIGMSPSSSISAGLEGTDGAMDSVLSPSQKPNTFIPLRRSNSFTNFFSTPSRSRSTSPSKPASKQVSPSKSALQTPPKANAATTNSPAEATMTEPVLAYLVLLDKKGRQKERFPIQSTRTTMGRSIDNDVRFLVSDVSRHHCTIEIEIDDARNTAYLQVLGANGVLLNKQLVLPAPKGEGRYKLQSGDEIVIAKRKFVFEMPEHQALNLSSSSSSSQQPGQPGLFESPVKDQPPATPGNRSRKIRMSLVNVAQIDTPARPKPSTSATPCLASTRRSPSKSPHKAQQQDPDRESRRVSGLNRFKQTAKLDNATKQPRQARGRQSLTLATTTSNPFATPVKSSFSTANTAIATPKTAPPKQVSFSLFSNGYTGRLSPVKQMRMLPPLDTMTEEQDTSLRSDASIHVAREEEDPEAESESILEDAQQNDYRSPGGDQEAEAEQQHESEEDIVILEELEEESASAAFESEPAESSIVDFELNSNQPTASPIRDLSIVQEEASISSIPASPAALSPTSSPSSSSRKASPGSKRPKRRSSFFGRAGPFSVINFGFYAEERAQQVETEASSAEADVEAGSVSVSQIETPYEQEKPQEGRDEEVYSDAPSDDHAQTEAEPGSDSESDNDNDNADTGSARLASPPSPSPSKVRRYGLSKTPSPTKKAHFVGLTPMPRRPRLSLTTRRRVSLRTQTLLRSSEAYADRLFLPLPPTSLRATDPTGAATKSSSGLSKSMSMPSSLSCFTASDSCQDMLPPTPFCQDDQFEAADQDGDEYDAYGEGHASVPNDDFEASLDPQLLLNCESGQSEEQDDEDEDLIEQSLSVLVESPVRRRQTVAFSPVKPSAVVPFGTPQPTTASRTSRPSLPAFSTLNSTSSPSKPPALLRLQISGTGERIVVAPSSSSPAKSAAETPSTSVASSGSPRKVVRVSDVGLPSSELSLGYDLVVDHDHTAQGEGEEIAQALNSLFDAEDGNLTDDEDEPEDEDDDDHETAGEAPAQEQYMQEDDDIEMADAEDNKENLDPVSADQESGRPTAAASLLVPQTPVALPAIRHMFSEVHARVPATPDMRGLGELVQTPPAVYREQNVEPEREEEPMSAPALVSEPVPTPRYGTLGARMRAHPDLAELMSSPSPSSHPAASASRSSTRSPKKKATNLGAIDSCDQRSPFKSSETPRRRARGGGIRRSQTAETPAQASAPFTPRPHDVPVPSSTTLARTTQTPVSVPVPTPQRLAFEAELHVTLIDTSVEDAANEALVLSQTQTEAPLDQARDAPASPSPMHWEAPMAAVSADSVQVHAPAIVTDENEGSSATPASENITWEPEAHDAITLSCMQAGTGAEVETNQHVPSVVSLASSETNAAHSTFPASIPVSEPSSPPTLSPSPIKFRSKQAKTSPTKKPSSPAKKPRATASPAKTPKSPVKSKSAASIRSAPRVSEMVMPSPFASRSKALEIEAETSSTTGEIVVENDKALSKLDPDVAEVSSPVLIEQEQEQEQAAEESLVETAKASEPVGPAEPIVASPQATPATASEDVAQDSASKSSPTKSRARRTASRSPRKPVSRTKTSDIAEQKDESTPARDELEEQTELTPTSKSSSSSSPETMAEPVEAGTPTSTAVGIETETPETATVQTEKAHEHEPEPQSDAVVPPPSSPLKTTRRRAAKIAASRILGVSEPIVAAPSSAHGAEDDAVAADDDQVNSPETKSVAQTPAPAPAPVQTRATRGAAAAAAERATRSSPLKPMRSKRGRAGVLDAAPASEPEPRTQLEIESEAVSSSPTKRTSMRTSRVKVAALSSTASVSASGSASGTKTTAKTGTKAKSTAATKATRATRTKKDAASESAAVSDDLAAIQSDAVVEPETETEIEAESGEETTQTATRSTRTAASSSSSALSAKTKSAAKSASKIPTKSSSSSSSSKASIAAAFCDGTNKLSIPLATRAAADAVAVAACPKPKSTTRSKSGRGKDADLPTEISRDDAEESLRPEPVAETAAGTAAARPRTRSAGRPPRRAAAAKAAASVSELIG